ncbi:Armadillo-like helical [Sergentomyia squamirostris]
MDFHSSISQLNDHLKTIQERSITDDFQLNNDINNLLNSLLYDEDLDEQDPNVVAVVNQLYILFQSSYKNPETFQQLLTIVSKLLDNVKTKQYLQEYEFVPLLANILQMIEIPETAVQERILTVMEKLTKDFTILSPDFYLVSLLPFLVDTIVNKEEVDTRISHLSLSIIANLCENRSGIDTLLKLTSTKELIKKTGTGLAKIKLTFLIDCFHKKTTNIQFAILSVFEQINRAFAENDQKVIEDSFSFIQKFAPEAMEACREVFVGELENLLDKLNNCLSTDSQPVNHILTSGLKLFSFLMKKCEIGEKISKSLVNFTLDCLAGNPCYQLESLQLLQALGECKVDVERDVVDRLNSSWPEMITWMEKETKTEKLLVILKVYHAFVQLANHQGDILFSVNRSTLHHLIQLHSKENVKSLSDRKILIILTILDLLVTFAAAEPQEWYGEADKAMKLPGIAEIIAEGIFRRNATMFQSCLNLLKFATFLEDRVIQLVHESPSMRPPRKSSPEEDKFTPIDVLTDQSTRINAILNTVAQVQPSGSSIAMLIQYQDTFLNVCERRHKEDITRAAQQIESLNQQIFIMTKERTHMRSLICQNELARETMILENEKCEQKIAEQHKSLRALMEKCNELTSIQEELRAHALEGKTKNRDLKEKIGKQEAEIAELKKANEYSQKVNEEMKKDSAKKNARIQHLEEKVKAMEAVKEQISKLMKF